MPASCALCSIHASTLYNAVQRYTTLYTKPYTQALYTPLSCGRTLQDHWQ